MEEFRKDRYIFSNKPGVIDVSEKSKKAREQQIKNFNKELFEYEVLLKDLALDRPNEKEKNLILNVAYYIAKDYDVVSSFKAKKVLNIGLVSRKTRISKKFLERWKHYLITYILIMESTNYKYIQEAGYIVVFEAEKSTLKRATRLDNTGSSLGNCEITDEQVRILISLDVEIVIALDEGIDINHIRKECEKFYPLRKVSYIYDRWDLIPKGSKNSPADMPNKIYNFLFKHRTVYDEKERKLYKDWLEKQNKN